MKNLKFYRCTHCGNLVVKFVDSGVPVVCCGDNMAELMPNTVEASVEKHLPVVTRINDCTIKIEIGAAPHPMTPEHHIDFVWVETEHGGRLVQLVDVPAAEVCTCDDKPVAVYAFCNLHGLWKTEIK